LRGIGARRPKAELSQVVFGLLAEGVQSGFGGLGAVSAWGTSLEGERSDAPW
jgi:hypothetical protein